MSFRSAFALSRQTLRAAVPSPAARLAAPRLAGARLYSTTKADEPATETAAPEAANPELEAAKEKLDVQSKTIAELKDARLRSLADFENLQKISAREKTQAKDFALTSFAKDLIGSIDILRLALNSISQETIADANVNKDLKELHTGVALTKAAIEKTLARHGVVSFDPVGEQFDPNLHEALYQAPVPGKEPGSVLETQELGYMIKDRLLRPAKVGVVLGQQ